MKKPSEMSVSEIQNAINTGRMDGAGWLEVIFWHGHIYYPEANYDDPHYRIWAEILRRDESGYVRAYFSVRAVAEGQMWGLFSNEAPLEVISELAVSFSGPPSD